MTYIKNRKAQKYLSDIFINPARALSLFFHPAGVILTGLALFCISETIHCRAHIRGALSKKKSNLWKAAKISIFVARLISSFIGSTFLALGTLTASAAINFICAAIYPVAFFVSSLFSTFHKIRGLLDHCYKSSTPSFISHLNYLPTIITQLWNRETTYRTQREKNMVQTFGLIGRASVGIFGSLLMGAVILFKMALVVGILSNPIGFGLGCLLMGLVVLQKAYKTYQHHKQIKLNSTPTIQSEKSSFKMDNANKALLAAPGFTLSSPTMISPKEAIPLDANDKVTPPSDTNVMYDTPPKPVISVTNNP